MRKEFFSAFCALVELSFEIKDGYLNSRLKTKNEQLFILFVDSIGEPNVAQSEEKLTKLAGLTQEIIEFVDLLLHLKIVLPSPALMAKKCLLAFCLALFGRLRGKSQNKSLSSRKEKNKPMEIKGDREFVEIILTFLRYRGKCQTRDIVSALKVNFSARTIQRYLRQMTKSGQLVKEVVDGYPKYSIKGEN